MNAMQYQSNTMGPARNEKESYSYRHKSLYIIPTWSEK